jgi:hypothetical protein
MKARPETDLDNVGPEAVGIANLVHIALEIEIEKLENEVELGFRMHNVEEPSKTVSRNISRFQGSEGNKGETHRTTFSSFISLRSEISRMAVEGTPSSSASKRIFLRATISPESVFFAVDETRKAWHRQASRNSI